jgi:hypothetical protein
MCLEASGLEFQRLFEKVAERVRPYFMRVRSYGKLGDRKCDGLFWDDGTVFQVYSPDEIRQADTLAKIEEDLSGAVAEWGDQLKRWVFVYNTRLGLGPDVPRMLEEQRGKYPNIVIEPLSSEALWELMRDLSLQQRAEILGAPSGYEHLFLLPGTVSEEIEKRLRDGRFVVVHDILSPINIQDAMEALKPELSFGPPFTVRPPYPNVSWELAAQYQAEIVEDALRRSSELLPRFAVFSLAPIPLAIHLGYLFSDRVEVRPFQYNRDRNTWRWDDPLISYNTDFRQAGLPERVIHEEVDVIVRVSLSAIIVPEDTIAAAGECPVQVDLSVAEPDVMWLCHPEQLVKLGQAFRRLLQGLGRVVPHCKRIHLFYAGPTGGAIVIGQAINPRMTPEVELYEYDRRRSPRYELALTLRLSN